MFPALFVLHLQNFTKSVFFKTCLFHSSADVALLFSGFQALWGEWGLIFVRVVVFQRQVKTLHGCPFLWNINTLLLPGRSLRAFVYRTSFPGLVRADVFITTPRGGRNITTCKTHHVGLQSPTCVYLLVLFFFWWRGQGAFSHDQQKPKNEKEGMGQERWAGTRRTEFSQGRAAERRFVSDPLQGPGHWQLKLCLTAIHKR